MKGFCKLKKFVTDYIHLWSMALAQVQTSIVQRSSGFGFFKILKEWVVFMKELAKKWWI